MKFGIIGFGRMGHIYKEVLDSLNIKTEFICDVIGQNISEKSYTDYKDAINQTSVDGIIISTYAPSHYEIIKYAINNDIKYIACEKPFTNSAKHADDIIKLLKNSRTRLNVNYIRRFSDSYEKLNNILYHDSLIGNPQTVMITSGAGGISTLGTHFIDLIRIILQSRIKSIYAVAIDHKLENPRGKQFEDPGGYAILNFQNKKRAFLEMSDDIGIQPKIEIIGEFGRIIIDELNNRITILARNKEDQCKKMRLYVLPNPVIYDTSFDFENITELTKKMIVNLISNKKLKASSNIIRDDIEIYSAIRKAFDTKKLVQLPLNDAYYHKEFMVT